MTRLSIDISPEQHPRLKAVAALHGKSIKDYVLEQALPPVPDLDALSGEEALQKLEEFLKPRMNAAKRGKISSRSVQQVFKDVRRKRK
jgi:hypothetical protein